MLFDQISENLKRERDMLNRVGKVEKWVSRTKSMLQATIERIELEV